MSDTQRDREERQHVIKVLQNMVDWMEAANYIVATPERRRALEYAIASIKTDLKYDLLYEETSGQADKPTTKNDLGVDAVSREAVLDMCKKEIDHISKNWQDYHSPSEAKSGFVYIATNIYDLPPVTPQQKIGQWIAYEVRLPDRTILNYRCSVCGRKLIGYNTETLSEAPFCHCGAKMLEPQESEDKE